MGEKTTLSPTQLQALAERTYDTWEGPECVGVALDAEMVRYLATQLLTTQQRLAEVEGRPAFADYYKACRCGHNLNTHSASSRTHWCQVEGCLCEAFIKAVPHA